MRRIDRYYDSLEEMMHRFDRVTAADRFTGGSADELISWQNDKRLLLSSLLGIDKLLKEESDCRKGPDGYECTEEERVVTEDGIVRSRLILRIGEHTYIPMFVLEPEGDSKGTFLALAGHQGAGSYSVAGVRDIPWVEEKIEFFNYDYGYKLAKLGYTAICPDPRGFGDRRDVAVQGDERKNWLSCSCRNLSNMAISMGLSVVGLCVYDYIRLIDYMEASGRWDTERLGCIGFSGGGMQTLYLSALDTRIKMAYISGYMYGYKDSLLILNNNCSCNYVPGLWEHFDMGDVGCLIAPRPLFIQSCDSDHLNGPNGLINVYSQVDIIRRAYALCDSEICLRHDIRQGGHHFHDEPLKETIDDFEALLADHDE